MSEYIPCEEWVEGLNRIQKGDCLYVVSDCLELAKAVREAGGRFSPDRLIDKLQELVGEEGTLLFPTFNWDFCQGAAFDYYKTPVKTGALSKAALKREEFARTEHALYSFAVWGKDREKLLANKNVNSFGPGTIFEYMYEKNAKVMVIGIGPLKGTTYIHHVEQMVEVPYRYNKEFTADYTDKDGNTAKRTYCMYVRDLEMDPKHINGFEPLAEKMIGEGFITTLEYLGIGFSFLNIRDLDKAVKEDILENDSRNMYVYHGQKKRGE